MKTVLVTGAAGFIGSHLTRALLQRGDIQVVAVDDLSGGFIENVPESAEFVQGSVTDPEVLDGVFRRHRVDAIYHLAAYAAEGLSHYIRHFNYTNNLLGSVLLINRAINHAVPCLVFTSSIAVYGTGTLPLREDAPPHPEDPYGIAKYAVELDLEAAAKSFGLSSVIFRPHNVYGEFQNIGDRYRNVVGIFMNQILRGQPMTILGDGEQQRAFSYVGDIIPVMVSAAFEPRAYGRVFNIGADAPYTVNALARAVAVAMGVPDHPVAHLPPRDEVKLAFSDHAAVRSVWGDGVQTPLEEGLSRMAAWVRRHGARTSPVMEGIEVETGLPAHWKDAISPA